MDNTVISSLTHALDFGSARLQAISGNLANVNTPGYKRQDVSFASLLEAAGQDDSAAPAGDASSDTWKPAPVTQKGGSMRPDGNNVDIDTESSRMAATEVYYQGAAQLLQIQFANLKFVIGGGR